MNLQELNRLRNWEGGRLRVLADLVYVASPDPMDWVCFVDSIEEAGITDREILSRLRKECYQFSIVAGILGTFRERMAIASGEKLGSIKRRDLKDFNKWLRIRRAERKQWQGSSV